MSAGQNREIVDEGRAMTPEEEDELEDIVPSLHNAAPSSHLPPLRIITTDPFLPPPNDDTDDESEGAPGGGGEGEDLGPPRHRGSSAPPTFRFVYDQQQHHAHPDENIPALDPYVPAAPTPTSASPHNKPNSKPINGHGGGTGSGIKRPRVSSCCRQCRERRVWCSRTSPCQSCLTRGNDCDWSGGFPVGNIPRSRPSSASTPRSSSNIAYPYPPPASRSRPSTAQSTGSPAQAMAASVSPQARSPVSPTLSGLSGGGVGTGVGGPGARARCRNSCHQCHTRKIRCSRTYPCTGCSSRGLECNWEGGIPIATAADDTNLRAAMADMENRAQALRQKCLQILAAGA